MKKWLLPKRLLLPLVLIWLACAAAVTLPAHTQPSFSSPIANSTTIFRPLLPKLQRSVPLRLPTYIPGGNGVTGEFTATLLLAAPTEYSIVIGATPDCQGGNYCRLGMVEARRIAPGTPSIQQQYTMPTNPDFQPAARDPNPMQAVRLTGGRTGYYIPWTLGASYSDSRVVWDEGGVRYSVGIKKGNKNEVIQMANSAIASTSTRR